MRQQFNLVVLSLSYLPKATREEAANSTEIGMTTFPNLISMLQTTQKHKEGCLIDSVSCNT